MARCDEGYVCEVCGKPVEKITQSSLYVRYVIGEVESRELLAMPERHLLCDPTLAQYIVSDDFTPVKCEGFFNKHELDTEFVAEREQLVTRGWHRLKEVLKQKLPISDYPLEDVK
jgi:hypothetical protein